MKTDRAGHLLFSTLRLERIRSAGVPRRGPFLWRVYEHGLAGLLVDALDRLGPEADPGLAALLPDLRANAAVQEATVRLKLGAAAEVSAALERAGLDSVWVKGVALSSTVYERPGLRPFGDLDLLVAPSAVSSVSEILRSLGFRREDSRPDTMAASFSRPGPGGGAAVDLHWDFVQRDGPQGAVAIPVGEILSRARRAGPLRVPASEDALLLGAANLVRSRVDRMILLVDFARLAASGVEWGTVLERAAAWKLKGSLWLGLTLSKAHLSAAVPSVVIASLAPGRWRAGILRGLLSGSALWARRKVRTRAVAYGLPFLCADSPADLARAILGSRGRILRRMSGA